MAKDIEDAREVEASVVGEAMAGNTPRPSEAGPVFIGDLVKGRSVTEGTEHTGFVTDESTHKDGGWWIDTVDLEEVPNMRLIYPSKVLRTAEELRNLVTKQCTKEASPRPICTECNDTHQMPAPEDSGSNFWMCTRCPTPCQKCRHGGNGPFCEETPCACDCHAKSFQYAGRRTNEASHASIGSGAGDDEGYIHPDVLASQSKEFQAEYELRGTRFAKSSGKKLGEGSTDDGPRLCDACGRDLDRESKAASDNAATARTDSPLGPKCPAGDACENKVYLEEYQKVDQIHRDTIRKNAIEECAKLAESQAPDVDDTGNGDEYRRGQKRGALDAATVIRRLVRQRTEPAKAWAALSDPERARLAAPYRKDVSMLLSFHNVHSVSCERDVSMLVASRVHEHRPETPKADE